MRYDDLEGDLMADDATRLKHRTEPGWYYCGYCGRATLHKNSKPKDTIAGCGGCGRTSRRFVEADKPK